MNARPILCAVVSSVALAAQSPVNIKPIDITISEGTAMAAAASPDHRWIAADLLGGIWVLPFRGGEARRLTPETMEARLPTWSPDSQRIAFQGFGDDGIWHIYSVRLTGEREPVALTRGLFDDREPVWSHDGQRIAFSTDRYGGISTVWTLIVSTGVVQQVATRDGWSPTWSPDDRALAFVCRTPIDPARPLANRPIFLCTIDASGEVRQLAAPSVDAPAWSPDGTRLAFVRNLNLQVGVLAGSSPGSTMAPLRLLPIGRMNEENVFPLRPDWLDNGEILYTADGHIRRRSLAGGRSVTIPFTAKISLQRATYPIVHRPLEPVGPQLAAGIATPTVSPNGNLVAFVALGDVWLASTDTGAARRLTDDAAAEADPAWSPDGTRLAYASDRSGRMQIWVYDFQSLPHPTQVTNDRNSLTGPAWSGDGNHLAFIEDGHTVREVTVVPDAHRGTLGNAIVHGALGRPTWAADSHTIAVGSLFSYSDRFADGLNQLMLVRLDPPGIFSTALSPGHSTGNREDNGPVWSPDGWRMAYVTEGRLWTVNVDMQGGATGPAAAIAPNDPSGTEEPESPSWEGDTRHIVYQTPAGLRRVIAEGGVPDPIPLAIPWSVAPTPDRVVVHAGHLIDGIADGRRDEVDIVIERGVIANISGHSDQFHAGRVVIAANETVMPGLIDMNVSFNRGYGANFGRALLAYGVTTVRVPGVNAYAAIAEDEAFSSGRRPGPRIIASGERFDGLRVFDTGGVSIASEAQLAQEYERAAALGSDFIAAGPRLPDRYLQKLVPVAHESGTPVASTTLYPAVAFGVDFVERITGRNRAGFAAPAPMPPAYADVTDLVVKSGVSIGSSLAIEDGFDARLAGDRTLLFDPRFALYPLQVVSQMTDLATRGPNTRFDTASRPREALVKAIADAGGRVVAASGSPAIPYGLGLHAELENLVHAGFTPYQALQMATINAARALGLDTELGTIEVGKLADLAFVDGDPMTDIRNARKVTRVMRGGRLYTVEELVLR